MDIVKTVSDWIWSPALLAFLIGAGLYFTIRTKFVQIRMIPEMLRLMFEKPEDSQGISSFQALSVALSGRVGTGNITGVASAIAFGGPGAVFWMWVIAFVGAGSAFVETTLGQVYKEEVNGQFYGGPAYYIEKGLKLKKLALGMALILAFSFAFLMSGIQVNGISVAMHNALSVPPLVSTLLVVGALLLIVLGGIQRIAKIAEIIVPFMAGVYLLMVFVIVIANWNQVIPVFQLIFKSAFGMEAVFGGLVGAAISYGVKRGVYSNEAGQGSQVAAAASAQISHPVKQGLVQAFSVYIDTLFVCTGTALVILLTNSYNVFDANQTPVVAHLANTNADSAGALYTQTALSTVLGSFGPIFVAFALVFFAFTTLMSYYYIAETNLRYLLKGDKLTLALRVMQVLMVGMLIYSGVASSQMAWTMGEIASGITVWLNVTAILFLSPLAFKLLKDYEQQKKEGKNPDFNPFELGIEEVPYWENRIRNKEK